jgi:hypothetical protein
MWSRPKENVFPFRGSWGYRQESWSCPPSDSSTLYILEQNLESDLLRVSLSLSLCFTKNATMVWMRKELNDIQIAERVTSALSLIGCSFIIISFSSSSAFRKPINRLIFYASFGNILSTVATLISRRGVEAGQNSVLCQLQAFFIQQ